MAVEVIRWLQNLPEVEADLADELDMEVRLLKLERERDHSSSPDLWLKHQLERCHLLNWLGAHAGCVCVSGVHRRYTSEVTGQQEEKTGCKISAAGIGMLMVFKATETEVIMS